MAAAACRAGLLAGALLLCLVTCHALALRDPIQAHAPWVPRLDGDVTVFRKFRDSVAGLVTRIFGHDGSSSTAAAPAVESRHQLNGVVTLADGKYDFTYRPIAEGPARGAFTDSRHTRSGFGVLHVTGNPKYTDEEQMHAAGFLEGWLTAERIYDHFHNMRSFFNMSTTAPVDWLIEQDAWAQQQAAKSEDGIWVAVRALLAQLDGLVEGYNARVSAANALLTGSSGSAGDRAGFGARAVPPPLTRADLLMVSGVGDLGDLIPALEADKRPAWHRMQPAELGTTLASRGKCSALVKVTGDLSDLLLAHSSWYTFAALQRLYKHYDLPLQHPALRLRRASFSSYAGELSSDDDFYLLDTGLAVLQTTNDILDASLYEQLTPKSLTSWQRVRAANMLATTGAEWAAAIDVHQSGTCNNQYMVVDLKRFRPRQELQAGLLTVVEQIPGLTVAADKTGALERGYWPSYNIPYFPEIYRRAGYEAFRAEQAQRGSGYATAVEGLSYQLAPRSGLFRRDAGLAVDVGSLQDLMRSNNWLADGYSRNSSLGAICGRGDINGVHPSAYGCYDTKVASFEMATQRWAYGVVGPTTAQGTLEPFRWDEQQGRFASVPHLGQPSVFDNQFELLKPWS